MSPYAFPTNNLSVACSRTTLALKIMCQYYNCSFEEFKEFKSSPKLSNERKMPMSVLPSLKTTRIFSIVIPYDKL